MNKPISAQPLAAVMAQRKAQVVPASTPSSADPPAAGVKAGADSVTISDAARLQGAMRDGPADAGQLSAASGSASMTRAERVMADLKASFMTKQGDDGFDAKLDFNRDGMINASDLGMLKRKMAENGMLPQPVADEPPAAPTLDSIRSAFFTREGEDGFDASADLNGDGVVNVRDMAMLRQSQEAAGDATQPVPFQVTSVGTDTGGVASAASTPAIGVEPVTTPTVAAAPQGSEVATGFATGTATTDTGVDQSIAADPATTRLNLLEALRDAFFSRAGDDRFDAALDSNGDGRLNVADFLSIRDQV